MVDVICYGPREFFEILPARFDRTYPESDFRAQSRDLSGKVVVRLVLNDPPEDELQDHELLLAHHQRSVGPQVLVHTRGRTWSMWTSTGFLKDIMGDAEVVAREGLRWTATIADSPRGVNVPASLIRSLCEWLDARLQPANPVQRLIALSEELTHHLRAALEQRDEVLQRLEAALASRLHAEERIRVLELQVDALEAQLAEANAALAAGDPALVHQSRVSLVAMATVVVSLLALASSVAQPFVSDYLSGDDTDAIVEAQREATAALEELNDPSPIDLTIDVALQCIVEGGKTQ